MIRLILPLLAAAAGIAIAGPAHADPDYDTCLEASESNADYATCGSAMLDRREAELNRVWKRVNAGLDPAVKQALLVEQRAWVAYKDKSCLTWTTGFFGREGQVINFYVCREDVIDKRIAYLENLGDPGEPDEAEGSGQ